MLFMLNEIRLIIDDKNLFFSSEQKRCGRSNSLRARATAALSMNDHGLRRQQPLTKLRANAIVSCDRKLMPVQERGVVTLMVIGVATKDVENNPCECSRNVSLGSLKRRRIISATFCSLHNPYGTAPSTPT